MSGNKFEFKTEVRQLLDLMIHSLYSHKEIFLRELISNASDAIDKARYESLTDQSLLEGAGEWRIRIAPDSKAGTLTVSDNGIGMTREGVIEALGTIAHSGTKEFMAALQNKELKDNPELIGQFGVGFYSAFMVADKVTVISKQAGQKDAPAVKWESSADGTFTVDDVEKVSQGTDVIVHLKEDERHFLEPYEIKNIVRKYSDYIEHPVVMPVEKKSDLKGPDGEQVATTEDEVLNSRKAIWLRDRAGITAEEYNDFYRHISHESGDPVKVIHYRAEGTSEFTALLYIPSKAPLGILNKDFNIGPALYVKRVQIMDHCEDLIPPYLRFVSGVVDSSDLPLNISREMLQSNRQIEVIRKNITKKILDTLAEMKRDEYEKYVEFFGVFGRVLKEGLHYDYSRKEQIADLILFSSTGTEPGKFTTLQAYLDGMKPGQNEIYYITGSKREEILNSPYIEKFRDQNYEVLIMTDEIDDLLLSGLHEYKGKKIKSALKGDVSLDQAEDAERKDSGQKFEGLLAAVRERLKNDVKDVRLSGRLLESACCLVMEEGGMDPGMEKILKAMGQELPVNKRILEINASHPVFEAVQAVLEKGGKEQAGEYIDMLYNEALLLEGSKPKDPAAFARSLSRLILENTKQHVS